MNDFLQPARRWMMQRAMCIVRELRALPRQSVLLGGAVTLVVFGGGVLAWMRWAATPLPPMSGATAGIEAPLVPLKPRWIDGTDIPTADAQPSAFAVVVDNAPEARPQTGIRAAPLVFVLPVEGQRTRFLAVYALDVSLVETITRDAAQTEYFGASATAAERGVVVGPVRSARPYAVALADALDVPFAHVGGSTEALELLVTRRHVDEYARSPFWRSVDRFAPFNTYTTVEGLAEFFVRRDWMGNARDDAWRLWPFAEDASASGDATSGVRIPYGPERAFIVEWRYDADAQVFTRFQGGRIQRDAAGEPVTAANVVLLSVTSRVLDRVGRIAIVQMSPATVEAEEALRTAVVLRDGARLDGTWAWNDPRGASGLFGLMSNDGATPIALKPGTTWIEVVNVNFDAIEDTGDSSASGSGEE